MIRSKEILRLCTSVAPLSGITHCPITDTLFDQQLGQDFHVRKNIKVIKNIRPHIQVFTSIIPLSLTLTHLNFATKDTIVTLHR